MRWRGEKEREERGREKKLKKGREKRGKERERDREVERKATDVILQTVSGIIPTHPPFITPDQHPETNLHFPSMATTPPCNH